MYLALHYYITTSGVSGTSLLHHHVGGGSMRGMHTEHLLLFIFNAVLYAVNTIRMYVLYVVQQPAYCMLLTTKDTIDRDRQRTETGVPQGIWWQVCKWRRTSKVVDNKSQHQTHNLINHQPTSDCHYLFFYVICMLVIYYVCSRVCCSRVCGVCSTVCGVCRCCTVQCM